MRFLGFLTALLVFFFGGQSIALAHDVLVDQDPQDGAVLESSPERITISFNNTLNDFGEGATIINVLDSLGNVVIDDTPTVAGMDAYQEVSELADGAYYVVWRVVSSDGHPISGASTFAVGPDGEALLADLPALDLSGSNDDDATDDAAEPGSEDGSIIATVMTIAAVLVAAAIIVFVFIFRTSRKSKNN